MRTRILLLLSFCICAGLHAQENTPVDNTLRPYDKYWQMETSVGANLDLSYTGSNPSAYLLSSRKEAALMWNLRFNDFFAKKWGWYANAQLNFYTEQKFQDIQGFGEFAEAFAKALAEAIFPGVSTMHPSIDAGVMYRIESKRFKLYPSVGIGLSTHISSRESTKERNGVTTKFEQSPGTLFAGIGLTGNYYFANKHALVLKATFQQPLQKSSARLIIKGGDEIASDYYESSTAGRTLTLSVGYAFAMKKKR